MTIDTLRPLGASPLRVSRLAFGSWRTYERLPRETGEAVMRAGWHRGQVGGLIAAGKARAWGVLNWPPSSILIGLR